MLVLFLKAKYQFIHYQVEVPDGMLTYLELEQKNAQGGVVRSKIHGPETPMHARGSGHRYLWTYDSLDIGNLNTRKSDNRQRNEYTLRM